MRKNALLNFLGAFGSVITAISFVEEPFFKENKIVFLIFGIVTLVIYFKFYIEEEAVSRIKFLQKRLNSIESKLDNRMNNHDKELSKIKGWIEAINFFKDKKGAIDPIILFIILAIVIIIILALQGKL